MRRIFLMSMACCLLLSGCQTMRRWRASSDASSGERMKQMEKQVEVMSERLERLEYELRFSVASNQVSLGKYQEAIQGYREVVNLGPTSPYAADSLYEIAVIYKYKLKKPEKALAAYDELLKRYPKSEFGRTAAYEIAESMAELGKKSEALAQYQKIISLYGRDAVVEKAYFEIGSIYEEEKKYKSAREAYEKLIEKFPAGPLRPAALYRIANYSLALADTAAAIRQYEKVYTEFPAGDFSELAFFDRVSALVAENSDSDAQASISEYLIRYPNGRYRSEAERFLTKIERKKSRTP